MVSDNLHQHAALVLKQWHPFYESRDRRFVMKTIAYRDLGDTRIKLGQCRLQALNQFVHEGIDADVGDDCIQVCMRDQQGLHQLSPKALSANQ